MKVQKRDDCITQLNLYSEGFTAKNGFCSYATTNYFCSVDRHSLYEAPSFFQGPADPNPARNHILKPKFFRQNSKPIRNSKIEKKNRNCVKNSFNSLECEERGKRENSQNSPLESTCRWYFHSLFQLIFPLFSMHLLTFLKTSNVDRQRRISHFKQQLQPKKS